MRVGSLSLIVALWAAGCSSDGGGNGDGGVGNQDSFRTEAGTYLEGGPVTHDLGQGVPDGTLPPVTGNGTCQTAHALTLSGGRVAIQGSTGGFADEFPTLQCGATIGAKQVNGPQAYFKFSGQAGSWYKVELAPKYRAVMYVFTNGSCVENDIQNDCRSGGASGINSRDVEANQRQAIYFQPSNAGDVFVGVDSADPAAAGGFVLTVSEISQPTNGSCAGAMGLSFANNKATVRGDIGINLTPPTLKGTKCDPMTLDGPQAFYTFEGQAGIDYHIKLTAEAGQFLFAYIFGDTCDPAQISSQCSSEGAGGDVFSIPLYSGEALTLVFAPPTTGRYKIGVGSGLEFNYGSYTLEVTY